MSRRIRWPKLLTLFLLYLLAKLCEPLLSKEKQNLEDELTAESLAVGYQVQTIHTNAIFKGLFIVIVLAVVMHVGLICIFFWWRGLIYKESNQSHILKAPSSQIPPSPQLQLNSNLDLQNWKKIEYERLHHYRWVDKDKGIVSIPIEDAFKRLIQGERK